jgi:hypothetical protein
MCLEKISKKKIATEDIVVYKLVYTYNDCLHTVFQYSLVEIGKTYHSKIKIINRFSKNKYIEIALHSFKNLNDAIIHKNSDAKKIVKCIIPKGAKYYEGVFDTGWISSPSFASDTIKYVEKIEIIET